MKTQFPDHEAPEVLQAIAKRLSEMTDEEWLTEINRRPEDVGAKWRRCPCGRPAGHAWCATISCCPEVHMANVTCSGG